MTRATMLLLVLGVFLISGCVSKSQYENEVRGLHSHVNNLTNQVTRLNAALDDTESSLIAERNRTASLQAKLNATGGRAATRQAAAPVSLDGLYRTQSGFELQARDIQRALKNAGYYKGSVDGKVGPETRNAIRNFQNDQDLTADGVVGKNTWSQLRPFLDVIK
jgi:peptidoglycan hydrolase-like protein with peptidoglycan-binding domain